VQILVLHPGALGDIVLALPALAALRRQFPRSCITVAGNTDYLPYSAWGHADRILSLSALPLHAFYGEEKLQGREAEWWASFDLLVSWTGAGHAPFEKAMAALGRPALVAAWRPRTGDPRHVSRIFSDSLHPGVPLQEQMQPARILIPTDGVLEAQDWLVRHRVSRGKPMLALHPGASGCGKRWPLDRFQSVAAFLESSHDFLIIEGPAEPGLAAELGRSFRPEGRFIAESLPLGLLAGILSFCHAYLGNDSGISHLAAALGLRSVVIFGPTQPEQWAPSGPDVQLLRDTTGCASCGGAGGDRHSCLENVTVERVRDCLTGLQAG